MNHQDTVIHSYWFDKTQYIRNIPQPVCIAIDDINILSNTLPNIFIYIEPRIIHNITEYLINNYNKYHMILTYDEDVLKKCPNAIKYIYGTSWIEKKYYEYIDTSKKQYKISNLAGSKLINNSIGHLFRQIIHHNQDKFKEYPITFFRSSQQLPHIRDYGNNPFLNSNNSETTPHNKLELFNEFQFSIVIENSRQTNYFTEKIVDCLITKTIPIYWGCPNINDFFNTTGWIILETTDINELYVKLKMLNENYYNSYTTIIEKNYFTSKKYTSVYDNINKALEFHSKVPIVSVNIMGGLGNQMFQLAAAYAHTKHNNCKLQIFKKLDNGNRPVYWDTYLTKWQEYLVKEPLTDLEIHNEECETKYTPIPDPPNNGLYLKGYYQSSKYYYNDTIKSEIKELMKPSIDQLITVNNKYEYLLENRDRVIIIHARRTDYLQLADIHGPLTIDYYIKALEKMLNILSNPIFVFTSDDNTFWDELRSAYPKINQYKQYILVESDINTITLLQQFSYYIMSNSTFIWWCVWLSNCTKHVIAPSKWFGPKGPINYNDIYEDNWERL